MKMYSLSCKDMDMPTCDYVAEGKNKEEVMKMAGEHFMKEHPEEAKEAMEKMTQKELDEKMMENMKEMEM